MKQYFLMFSFLLVLFFNGHAQKYMTKTGTAYFMSHTDAIDIDGSNNKVAAIIDASNGDIVIVVLVKAFELPLATADKHFNETYMESDKFPKATFKGKIIAIPDLDSEAEHQVIAQGILTIHGQGREIEQEVKLKQKEGKLIGSCNFDININDYNIKVPNDVKDRVAKVVHIEIQMVLEPYVK